MKVNFNKSKTIIKNQHYISEFLLRRFVNDNKKLFEVLLEKKKIYSSSPSKSMCARYTYEYNNLPVNTIENYFSKIEREVAPEIDNLIDDINKHKKGLVEFSIIRRRVEKLLPTFLIFYYRSGALLTEFSSIHKEDKIPLLSEKILNELYINSLADTIKKGYKFALIESNNKFIMSDQYVSTAALRIKGKFTNICNRTIGIKETIIFIPITDKFYIVYWHSDSPFFLQENVINVLNEEEVRKVNRTIINNSYYKCIGSNEVVLKELLNDYHWSSPTQVYWGNDKTGYCGGAIKKKEVFFYEIDREAYNNLDLFLTKTNYDKLKNLRRNDPCFCGSKKKFKKCHENMYERLKPMIYDLRYSNDRSANKYIIPYVNVIELPIDQWSVYKKQE